MAHLSLLSYLHVKCSTALRFFVELRKPHHGPVRTRPLEQTQCNGWEKRKNLGNSNPQNTIQCINIINWGVQNKYNTHNIVSSQGPAVEQNLSTESVVKRVPEQNDKERNVFVEVIENDFGESQVAPRAVHEQQSVEEAELENKEQENKWQENLSVNKTCTAIKYSCLMSKSTCAMA